MLRLLPPGLRSTTTHGELRKQWFSDEAMDLILSCDDHGVIRAFQLCYGKPWTQKALMWTEANGTGHFCVDDGEGNPSKNCTPLLQPGGGFDGKKLAGDFLERSGQLRGDMVFFVVQKIEQYASEQRRQ
ncbi:MAG: hypothetical protein ACAI35_07985 [Candidatus Methylacidiphilales bacterium]|nr:hypothetical protein [Candidatus Methylacidiphilales bacterium]